MEIIGENPPLVNELIELQGIEWSGVSFNPKASLVKKIISYATLGYFEHEDPNPILDNAYGHIQLGELVALMGPSGAGKSSLMKCLTEGICLTGFSGTISSCGIQEKIRASIIHQDEKEHLILGLTVRETLTYASKLKNRYWCPPGNNFHEENVQQLLGQLGLDNQAENPVSKCSGGERKRLAIGVELTEKIKPHILFLDEPTTGLDSSVAYSVIKCLKTVTRINNRMAIISTIHQPSAEILNVFDKNIMLTLTGAIMYHDNPSENNLRNFLGTVIPAEHRDKNWFKCFQNPADLMIGIASSLRRGQQNNGGSVEEQDGPTSCCTSFQNSIFLRCAPCANWFSTQEGDYNNILDQDQQRIFERPLFDGNEDVANVCRNMITTTRANHLNPFPLNLERADYSNQGLLCRTTYSIGSYLSLYGFWTLLKRTWKLRIVLGKNTLILRLFIYLFLVFFTTRMYSRDIGKDGGCIVLQDNHTFDPQNCTCFETKAEIEGETNVVSNIKLIFFFLLFLSLESLLNVTLTFPTEFQLFLHEFRNGWYSTPAYFLAKFLVELPGQLVIPTAYSIYFYLYTQQEDFGIVWNQNDVTGERFKIYLRATYLSGFIAQGLGFLIGILCVASVSRAILLSVGTIIGLSFFSGFFKKRVLMTDAEQLTTQCSFFRYALETMLISIYGRGRCPAPKQAYAMAAYRLSDDDLHDNWVGFLRLIVVTWGLTFVMLQLKASKWYLFKLIRRFFVGAVEFLEERGICEGNPCRICWAGTRDVLRKPGRRIWNVIGNLCVICIYLVVILGVLPLAVYIAVVDFQGAWS